MATRKVSIGEAIDSSPFTSFQFFLCGLCCLVTLLDGFDINIISIALPKMAEALRVKPQAFGPALSAGQFGPLIGAIVLGMLADRLGRKWMLTISAVIFGVFTLLTAVVTNVDQLAVFRFFAGIGLGGAVPLALALGTEYAPGRVKSSFATTMYAGMPMGGVIGGLAAIWLIPKFGWPSLFVLGGVIPLVVAVILIVGLPESLHFLVRHGKGETKIRRILARIAPALAQDREVEFVSSEKKAPGVPFKLLFTEGRASITVLIWIAMTGALYGIWALVSWVAVLLKQSGATLPQYSMAMAAMGVGAALAMLVIGRLMDKFNPFKVLAIGFTCAFFCLVAFGMFAGSPFVVVFIVSLLCGLFFNGSQGALMAVAPVAYPPAMRGTGTGWAYAISKLGAMSGPAVGAVFLSWNWSVVKICSVNAISCLIVAASLLLLNRRIVAMAARNHVTRTAATVQ
jgi:AAHS family 4-hydroxybenzoate transporter-like MFS transporter